MRALGGIAFAGRVLLGGALMAAAVASAGGAAAEPERSPTPPPAKTGEKPAGAGNGAGERVSIGDIEDRFRALEGAATEVISERTSGPNFILWAVGGSVLLLALVYTLGRRRGRRRGSVLEIRRVV